MRTPVDEYGSVLQTLEETEIVLSTEMYPPAGPESAPEPEPEPEPEPASSRDGSVNLRTQKASVTVVSVSVRALVINNKQVTLAVYRQLDEECPFDENGLIGNVWGRVNYFWGECDPVKKRQHDRDVGRFHLHLVWEQNGELYRSCVTEADAVRHIQGLLFEKLPRTSYPEQLRARSDAASAAHFAAARDLTAAKKNHRDVQGRSWAEREPFERAEQLAHDVERKALKVLEGVADAFWEWRRVEAVARMERYVATLCNVPLLLIAV